MKSRPSSCARPSGLPHRPLHPVAGTSYHSTTISAPLLQQLIVAHSCLKGSLSPSSQHNLHRPYLMHGCQGSNVVHCAPALVQAQPALALGQRGHLLAQLPQELRSRDPPPVQHVPRLERQQSAQVPRCAFIVLSKRKGKLGHMGKLLAQLPEELRGRDSPAVQIIPGLERQQRAQAPRRALAVRVRSEGKASRKGGFISQVS